VEKLNSFILRNPCPGSACFSDFHWSCLLNCPSWSFKSCRVPFYLNALPLLPFWGCIQTLS